MASHHWHLAGADTRRAVSSAGDFSAASRRRHFAGADMRRAVSFVGDFSASVEMTKCTQPIKPSPSGEGGLPKHREGKTDEGKTTLFYQ